MTGLSISTTPSRLFKKLRKNPYEKASSASFNPAPVSTATNTPGPHIALSNSQRIIPLRPALPREAPDLLAEARQAAGRDPVTGRQRTDIPGQVVSERRQPLAGPSQATDLKQAYIERARQSGQRPYESYEVFVQEMVAKRTGDAEALRAARGGKEYYAPERRVEEYYAGGGRG